LQFPLEQGFFKRRVGHLRRLKAVAGGRTSIVILLLASKTPLRKAIEETCPSAVARKLKMKRNDPGGTSD
jgi:hypothetical protein